MKLKKIFIGLIVSLVFFTGNVLVEADFTLNDLNGLKPDYLP